MRKPASMWSLETLGRVRLSKYFFMREFLYSEIGNFYGLQNIPENPDLVIEVGRAFCTPVMIIQVNAISGTVEIGREARQLLSLGLPINMHAAEIGEIWHGGYMTTSPIRSNGISPNLRRLI